MRLDWDLSGLVSSFLGPAAVAGVVSFLFQRFTRGKLDNYFAKQLEAFKAARRRDLKTYDAELSRLADAAKFDYARRLADFNLFAVKRHAVYAGLWRRYRAAFDAYQEYEVRYHRGRGHDQLDKADFTAMMARNRVPRARRESVLATWALDRGNGVTELHRWLDRRAKRHARALLDTAQRFWLANYLYASDDVNEFVRSGLVRRLVDYVRCVEKQATDPDAADEIGKAEQDRLRRNVQEQFKTLVDVLRKELRGGDDDASAKTSLVVDDLERPGLRRQSTS